jgi:PAS domain S-box-containing protein
MQDEGKTRRQLIHELAVMRRRLAELESSNSEHPSAGSARADRGAEETTYSQRLLLALSQAAGAVQRARTPQEVYRALGDQVTGLGYHATILTLRAEPRDEALTEDGAHLAISHLTCEPGLLRAAEKLTGLSVQDYRFPLVPGGFFQRVMAEEETMFVEESIEQPIAESLPEPLRPLVGRLMTLLGLGQSIIAPLAVAGEAHGLLIVTGDGLTEADVPAVSVFANQAAIALENARLFAETQRRAEQMAALRQINMALTSTLERDQILDMVLDQLKTILDYDSASIQVLSGPCTVRVAAARPPDHDEELREGFDTSQNPLFYEMKEKREIVVIDDVHRDARWAKVGDWEQVRSWVGVPLFRGDNFLGFLNVEKGVPGFYQESDVQLLRDFAPGAALAIDNAPLFEEAQQEISERVRAEEALRESETTLRIILATAPIGIGHIRDRILDWANETMYAMVGWEPGALLGQNARVLYVDADEYERVGRELYGGIMESGIGEVETRWVRKDGQIIDCVIVARSIDPSDPSKGQIIAAGEITERVRAEEALRVSEERFALAVRGSNAGLWDWDILNSSLYWSPRLKELLGYADDELDVDFDTFESHLHPDDREPTRAAIEAHLKHREPYDVKQRLRTKSGEYRWFRARGQALWDEAGNPRRMVGSTTDITEQVQAEAALARSKAEFEAIFNSISDAAIFVDNQRRIVLTNPAFTTMWGYDSEELKGKTTRIIYVDEADYQATGREHYSVDAAGSNPIFEMRYRRKDGTLFLGETLGTRVKDTQGNVLGFVGIHRDITERVRAEEALREHSERLEEMVEERTRELREAQERLLRREKLAALGQLAGGVAHELRTPLGAIKNAAYYLNLTLSEGTLGEAPDPGVKEALEILDKEVGTSERIIRSLLDFARTRTPARQEASINDLVREALSRIPVPESVRVLRQLDESLPAILADPDQLSQVFGNLILNAVQAMPDGGCVTISTELIEPDLICNPQSATLAPALRAGASAGVRIQVSDTGAGIPKENREKLFEPLFTTKPKGIGLGLALVKTLVEGHGGSMEVASEVGKGSTFTVRLPLAEADTDR